MATALSTMAGRWMAKTMSAETRFPADLTERRALYDRWLASTGLKRRPLMDGLQAEATLELDAPGLAMNEWDDLPIDYVPPGGAVLHGGYGEDRAIYDTPIFNPPGAEPRTTHLGLDVFATAGAPVFAPLDGRVHSLRRNDNAKDYGPTLILEHTPQADVVFYTLYGHLAPSVLDRFQTGDPVRAGDEIAQLGASDVNGGWAPHLHFQLILDLMGHSGDFPGVCTKSDADHWLTLCPDPRPFLSLLPGR